MSQRLLKTVCLIVGVIGSTLGATRQSFAEKMPEGLRLGVAMTANNDGGVKIAVVYEQSPAEAIGLKPGHIIHSIDGKLFNDPAKVRDYVLGKTEDKIDVIFQDGVKFTQVLAKIVPKVVNVQVSSEVGIERNVPPMFVKKTIRVWEVESRKEVHDPRKK